jgi:hypothetical protein
MTIDMGARDERRFVRREIDRRISRFRRLTLTAQRRGIGNVRAHFILGESIVETVVSTLTAASLMTAKATRRSSAWLVPNDQEQLPFANDQFRPPSGG